jgi:hypothetical protein
VSVETTANGRERTTAASSPVQRTTRSLRGVSAAEIAAISARSFSA